MVNRYRRVSWVFIYDCEGVFIDGGDYSLQKHTQFIKNNVENAKLKKNGTCGHPMPSFEVEIVDNFFAPEMFEIEFESKKDTLSPEKAAELEAEEKARIERELNPTTEDLLKKILEVISKD